MTGRRRRSDLQPVAGRVVVVVEGIDVLLWSHRLERRQLTLVEPAAHARCTTRCRRRARTSTADRRAVARRSRGSRSPRTCCPVARVGVDRRLARRRTGRLRRRPSPGRREPRRSPRGGRRSPALSNGRSASAAPFSAAISSDISADVDSAVSSPASSDIPSTNSASSSPSTAGLSGTAARRPNPPRPKVRHRCRRRSLPDPRTASTVPGAASSSPPPPHPARITPTAAMAATVLFTLLRCMGVRRRRGVGVPAMV